MQTADIAITVPKDCLPMGAECADLGDAESPAVDTGDACEVSMISEATNAQTGTYETEGNTFVTIDDAEMMADEPGRTASAATRSRSKPQVKTAR